MCTLKELITEQKKCIDGITDNQTLDAFSLDYCELLDDSKDEFVIERRKKCCDELKKMQKVDYDSRIKTAYESYCEAITYIDLKRLCDICAIHECRQKTPDFKICSGSECVYVEMKSLSFADGNMNYKKSQESALLANISKEEQIKKGNNIIWTERVVLPMAKNGHNTILIEQLKILYKKIVQNIKKEQFTNGNTILLIDLNQLGFGYCASDYVAIEKSYNGIGFSSGLLWTLAFANEHDKFFVPPEFEGKPNIEKNPIGFNGILIEYPELKGLLFAVGREPDARAFVGFYKYDDQDSNSVKIIQKVSSFYNDERNSYCFNVNEQFVPVRQIQL